MPSEAWLDKVDLLVGQHIMEWTWGGWSASDWKQSGWPVDLSPFRHWEPTRNREQAMLIFERCGDGFTLTKLVLSNGPPSYMAGIWEYEDLIDEVGADTPMIAISLASLKRAKVEVPADE